MRHTLGLFHGQTGSSFWKRYLSENMCVEMQMLKKLITLWIKLNLIMLIHRRSICLVHYYLTNIFILVY